MTSSCKRSLLLCISFLVSLISFAMLPALALSGESNTYTWANSLAESTGTTVNYRFERMWPTLKQPWYFYSPSGIAIDKSGVVYIADAGNSRIQKFTSDGQFVTKWGSFGSGDGEFFSPSGIAIDKSGFVYVTDSGTYRIQKFTSDGEFVTKWGGPGSGDGQFRQPAGIAIDGSGFVYVADFANYRIQKFTSDGEFVTKWGSEGSGDGQFDLPRDIVIDKSGFVYVADAVNSRIQKFTSVGEFVDKWGSEGSGDGQFKYPSSIAIDGNGFVYVTDAGTSRIQKFTLDGEFVTKWGSEGNGDGQFNGPWGIAIDSYGFAYVSDFDNKRIQKFTSDGEFVTKWGSSGSGDGQFNYPEEIEIDKNGSVYVVDAGNDRIQKFTSDGEFVSKWGSGGSGDGQFAGPSDIAIDGSGFVYVADSGNHRIQKLTSDGVFVDKWGSEGSGDGQFSWLSGIAIDKNGVVYVVDAANSRIQKFTSDGTFITKWGSEGTGDGQFRTPSGIAIDGSGFVYVVEFWNSRVQKFTSDGKFVTKWGSGGSREGLFDWPSGIAIDESGLVYVADTFNDRIQVFEPDGDFLYTFGTNGSEPGQLNQPFGVAASATNGKIYVADTSNNRIQVFKEADIEAPFSKAIIVAGRASADDILWDATQMCTNSAYRALSYQGFTKDSIYYLTSDTDLDINSDGVSDVDGEATNANLEYGITEWAKDADSLVLYFADHGGEDIFRMSETETLSASTLSSWLDELETNISDKIIVVYEACESGSFVDDLEGDNRIIITSTLPGEKAKFLSHGTISFSSFFWTHIFNGLSIGEAYLNASQVINFAFENQNPMLSGEAENVYLGNAVGNMIGGAPEIGNISPPQEIDIETQAELYAENITDPEGDSIARVWAVIWPPDYIPGPSDDPLLSLPTLDLLPAGGGRYSGTYTDFSTDGTYQVAIYAMDSNNNTSIPKLTTVSKNYHVSRKALIVAGDASESLTREMIDKNAELAYNALQSQLYNDSDIYLMSVTEIEGFDASPSLFNLEIYLSSLLFDFTTANLDLTIYLVGDGDEGTFNLNDTETLTVPVLDGWLDNLQNGMAGRVTFIYEAFKSGSFIPLMTPPVDKERVLITSTGEEGEAYFNEEGYISFSYFFWDQVSGGATVYDSFAHAKKSISYLSRKGEISFSCYREQDPLLEADGNSLGNEETDYEIARDITIGMGMKFADDPPYIGSVSVTETEGVVTIAAEDITATGTLKRVWAVIKPIGYCPGESAEEAGDMPEVELTDPDGDGRYEGTYSDPLAAFKVQVYAMDADSNTSLPKETKIYQDEGQDIYEVDDTRDQANVIVVDHPTPQPHNFHAANDEDWITFYGLENEYYTIMATNLEADCKPALELYYESDTTPTEVENLIVNNSVSIDFECLKDGIYYVKLYNETDGEDTGYDLLVDHPYWPGLLVLITGSVEDQITGEGIDRAFIRTEGGGTFSSPGGRYALYQKSGDWMLEVSADRYVSYFEGISLEKGDQIISKDIILDPTGAPTTTTVDPNAPTTTTIPGLCSAELIYGENSEQTELLRYFRDTVLSQTPEGREIMRLYYEWSPAIVKTMEEDEVFKEQVKALVDGVLELIEEVAN